MQKENGSNQTTPVDENYIKNKIHSCIDPNICGCKSLGYVGGNYAQKIKKICDEKGITFDDIERFSQYRDEEGNLMPELKLLLN